MSLEPEPTDLERRAAEVMGYHGGVAELRYHIRRHRERRLMLRLLALFWGCTPVEAEAIVMRLAAEEAAQG